MARARSVVSAAALVLLAGLVAWWLSRPAPSLETAGRAPGAQIAQPAHEVTELHPTADEPPASSEREVVAVAPQPAAPPPAAAEATSEPSIRGRLVVIELDGSERTDADGTLTCVPWSGELGRPHELEVVDGAWSFSGAALVGLEAVSFQSALVDGRYARVEEPVGQLQPPLPDEILVRARFAAASVLRVLDAQSGVDLDGVVLVDSESFPQEDARHPGVAYDGRVRGRELRSPIALAALGTRRNPFGPGPSRLLVGAHGRAWDLVQIDTSIGGEFVVELARGADLALDARGVDPNAGTLLRLCIEGRPAPWVEVPLRSDGPVELLGLAPGTYAARAEVGNYWDSPIVLGEVSVELRAGELTQAVLELKAAPVLELADASGVVFIHQGWNSRSPQLSLELLDVALGGKEGRRSVTAQRVASERDGYDAFRWSEAALQVGRYELELYKPPFCAVFELLSGGRSDVEVTVPGPVECLVHVVDDVTGLPEDVEQVPWHQVWPAGVSGGGLENADRTGPGEFRIRAPQTEIELMIWAWKYQPYNERVDLARGVREHTVRLQRGCGMAIKLLDGETPVAFPKDWYLKLECVSGSGRTTLQQLGDYERKLMVTEPGTYTLEVPSFSGYEPVPTQTIDIAAGHFTEHVVQLVRKH
jgi:hypothetical protein